MPTSRGKGIVTPLAGKLPRTPRLKRLAATADVSLHERRWGFRVYTKEALNGERPSETRQQKPKDRERLDAKAS